MFSFAFWHGRDGLEGGCEWKGRAHLKGFASNAGGWCNARPA